MNDRLFLFPYVNVQERSYLKHTGYNEIYSGKPLDLTLTLLNLTCDTKFIKSPMFLVHMVSRNIITQSNGCHGYEAIIESIEEVPGSLDVIEDTRRYNKDHNQQTQQEDGDVEHTDLEYRIGVTELFEKKLKEAIRNDHEPLYQSCEHDQSHGNSYDRIQDAEDLASF